MANMMSAERQKAADKTGYKTQTADQEIGSKTLEAREVSSETDARWNILVFMGAGPVQNDPPLDAFVKADLEEIKTGLASGDWKDKVNVLVEIHGLGRPTRQHIGVDPEPLFVPDDGGGVDGRPVLAFLEWAIRKCKPRRHDHSLLVLWGHAYEFAIGRQQTLSGVDGLDVAEFAGALRRFQELAKEAMDVQDPDYTPKLDIVGFDTCDAATLELANQLEPFAKYLLASQIGVPLPGWTYDTIIQRLLDPRNQKVMSPADLGSFVVRKFAERYSQPDLDRQPRPVSLTLLDLARAPEAFDAAELLAGALARASASDPDEMQTIVEQFVNAQTIDGKPFIDVADFCLNLSRNSSSTEVLEGAQILGDILIRPRPETGSNGRGSLIVEIGRNAHQTAKLHGVSLYAPLVVDENDFDWRTSRFWYNKFDFTGETFWGRLVHVLAEAN